MKYLRRDLPRAIVCCLVLGLGISIAAATAAAQCVSGPQMLAGWDFNGVTNYGDNDFFPISPDPESEDRCAFVTGLTRNWTSGTTGAASNAWGGNSFAPNTTGVSDAVAAGDFVTFSIKAVPGTTISLSEIAAHRIRRSSTGPSRGQWQYSIDGGVFANIGSALSWSDSSSGNAQSPIDLSGFSEMQNLVGATTITFRLVVWAATGTSGTWYLMDPTPVGPDIDFAINGSVVLAPTAADAVVKGQVVDSFGGGISGAMVTLISRRGERRTVITSSFGYFRFSAVETGETYVVTASSKRHRFQPRSVTVADNIDDLRITALP